MAAGWGGSARKLITSPLSGKNAESMTIQKLSEAVTQNIHWEKRSLISVVSIGAVSTYGNVYFVS